MGDVIDIRTGRPAEPVTIVDKRRARTKADALAENGLAALTGSVAPPPAQAQDRAQLAKNVTNLAGNLWWHAQGATQRGDHLGASRHHIARTRVLAQARREGVIE
ncbi:hypothetical protein KAYACHO_69 [Mycobacterium phage KayaCho]|uniref:hypothetical protein n=1 Tax=Mycobacterium phage KayaCho TaxID=1340830 RepID=UPI000387EE26|nr:hypothetical protein N846_gp69 [Mycobacterium phage KayaCho]AGT12973.1 hypothetical protein KAYACHO_69 [Mycobacterium phage KayaCho]